MGDVFGKAIRAYYQGDLDAEIIVQTNVAEDETLPASYFFREDENFPEYEKIALSACVGRVLDLGAGAGCHSLFLQNSGFDVTSVELSSGAAEVMQIRGLKNVRNCSILDLPFEKFDTILLLMNGIGMAKTLEDLPDFFQHLKNYLSPNGQILLDSTDLQYLYMDEEGAMWIDLNADYYGNVEYSLLYHETEKETFPWLYVDPENLSLIAKDSGFESEILLQDEDHHYLARLIIQ